jgi:hypothetical protein
MPPLPQNNKTRPLPPLPLLHSQSKLSELEAQKASGHTETKGSKFGSYSRYMPPSLVAHKEPLADAISAESKGVIDTKEALKVGFPWPVL